MVLWTEKKSKRTQSQIENKIRSTRYRLLQLAFYVAFKYILFIMKYLQNTENYRDPPTSFV